ncbi:hypothetical protein BDZ91DRAFT_714459 [Kalaharituber pfeilii]|nr:hypothetical protein BDZ91DRAFT_714459 [Kalaharituber pfeilii]
MRAGLLYSSIFTLAIFFVFIRKIRSAAQISAIPFFPPYHLFSFCWCTLGIYTSVWVFWIVSG